MNIPVHVNCAMVIKSHIPVATCRLYVFYCRTIETMYMLVYLCLVILNTFVCLLNFLGVLTQVF